MDEAKRLAYGDRNHDYGTPAENHGRTAALWSEYLGIRLTARDVCAFNILQKLSRERHRAKRDNLIDVAGYADNMDRCPEDTSPRDVAPLEGTMGELAELGREHGPGFYLKVSPTDDPPTAHELPAGIHRAALGVKDLQVRHEGLPADQRSVAIKLLHLVMHAAKSVNPLKPLWGTVHPTTPTQ